MRHYGKCGPQCTPPPAPEDKTGAKVRNVGRSVLFGRVPSGVVLWMGVAAVATTIAFGLISFRCLDGARCDVKDPVAAIKVKARR